MAPGFWLLSALLLSAVGMSAWADPGPSTSEAASMATRTTTHAHQGPAQPRATAAWKGNAPRLPTRWSKEVTPDNVLPEYPRPQLRRNDWVNLNGVWEFERCKAEDRELPTDRALAERILVPFAPQSALSGLGHDQAEHMWYKRTFALPPTWAGRHVLLHLDAVDYECWLWVNGHSLGSFVGGYQRITVDITEALGGSSVAATNTSHELIVRVYDPTDNGETSQPMGKQRLYPEGIWYTAISGIWQTVWLEPVDQAYIQRADLVPDVPKQELRITVQASDAATGMHVEAHALVDNLVVAHASGQVGQELRLKLHQPRLWTPEEPFLYDLDLSLVPPPAQTAVRNLLNTAAEDAHVQHSQHGIHGSRSLHKHETHLHHTTLHDTPAGPSSDAGDTTVISHSVQEGGDTVRAYFGMRSIELAHVGGVLRPVLNGQFVFQMGLLDQGFWPDGLYTPPTDSALVFDIETAKSWGYNMLRKHIKVEPDRWYYHADRLGMLVWQDQVAMHDAKKPNPADRAEYERQFRRMIQDHMSFPSIVVYVVFNEGWGQYETERVTREVMALDPSRLFDCASGWNDAPVGHLLDFHTYVGPESPVPTRDRAAVQGEFGGLGLQMKGHLWDPHHKFDYRNLNTTAQLMEEYLGLVGHLEKLMLHPGLSAAVYTELTDVEIEVNGLMTYDREVAKVDGPALAAAHRRLLASSHRLNHAVAAS